jgi:hypothetical protein
VKADRVRCVYDKLSSRVLLELVDFCRFSNLRGINPGLGFESHPHRQILSAALFKGLQRLFPAGSSDFIGFQPRASVTLIPCKLLVQKELNPLCLHELKRADTIETRLVYPFWRNGFS